MKCEVTITQSVVEETQHYFKNGEKVYIDLEAEKKEKLFNVIDVTIDEVRDFRNRFQPLYLERLDDGEADTIVHLFRLGEPWRICSADAIVYKVLAVLGREELGISLEKLLAEIGLGRKVPTKCSETFLQSNYKRGREDEMRGRARRSE